MSSQLRRTLVRLVVKAARHKKKDNRHKTIGTRQVGKERKGKRWCIVIVLCLCYLLPVFQQYKCATQLKLNSVAAACYKVLFIFLFYAEQQLWVQANGG
jgi:hypothetical protein